MVTKVEAYEAGGLLFNTQEEAVIFHRRRAGQDILNELVGRSSSLQLYSIEQLERKKDDFRRMLDILDGKLDVALGIIEG